MAVSEKVRRLAENYADLSDEERHEFLSLVAPADEHEVGAESRDELHQRARDIDEGRVQLIDDDDILRRLRAI